MWITGSMGWLELPRSGLRCGSLGSMFPAALIQIILVLLVVGVLLWAIDYFPAIDATIKQIIKVIIIVVVALWAIYLLFGMTAHGLVLRH